MLAPVPSACAKTVEALARRTEHHGASKAKSIGSKKAFAHSAPLEGMPHPHYCARHSTQKTNSSRTLYITGRQTLSLMLNMPFKHRRGQQLVYPLHHRKLNPVTLQTLTGLEGKVLGIQNACPALHPVRACVPPEQEQAPAMPSTCLQSVTALKVMSTAATIGGLSRYQTRVSPKSGG